MVMSLLKRQRYSSGELYEKLWEIESQVAEHDKRLQTLQSQSEETIRMTARLVTTLADSREEHVQDFNINVAWGFSLTAIVAGFTVFLNGGIGVVFDALGVIMSGVCIVVVGLLMYFLEVKPRVRKREKGLAPASILPD
jgi:hypothetical protein